MQTAEWWSLLNVPSAAGHTKHAMNVGCDRTAPSGRQQTGCRGAVLFKILLQRKQLSLCQQQFSALTRSPWSLVQMACWTTPNSPWPIIFCTDMASSAIRCLLAGLLLPGFSAAGAWWLTPDSFFPHIYLTTSHVLTYKKMSQEKDVNNCSGSYQGTLNEVNRQTTSSA